MRNLRNLILLIISLGIGAYFILLNYGPQYGIELPSPEQLINRVFSQVMNGDK